MQTFLPFYDTDREYSAMDIYQESAYLLDRARLGKQRVETYQIMRALIEGKGWINHPATKMWRGHLWSLLEYQRAVCEEWTVERGYNDTCLEKTAQLYFEWSDGHDNREPPSWLGDRDFHVSHQSNLIRKDPGYYMKYFPGVPDDLPYIWPTPTNAKEHA